MPRIKNPNSDGRVVEGIGIIGPGEVREVSDALAADLCDGVNFVRVPDAPAKSSRTTSSNDD